MGWNLFEWLDNVAEDLWHALDEDPAMILARGQAKEFAEAYHLDGDDEEFRELWFLMMKATVYQKQVHDAAEDAVYQTFFHLADLVDKAPEEPTRFGKPIGLSADDGLAMVQVAETAGRYVIFSDFHMLQNGTRQNFFQWNRPLYIEILRDYYGVEEFTLVENGDVEELLIYEPVLAEIEGIGGWKWDQVLAYRSAKKRLQLAEIVRDNREVYQTIGECFIDKQKYFRLTGNHDRDMRLEEFAGLVSATSGVDYPVASDVLLLRDGDRVDYMICHGHQFDTSCTPSVAPYVGESFSQGMGWAIQGPDRYWRTALDPIGAWLAGDEVFRNELVTSHPEGLSDLEVVLGDVGSTVQDVADALGGMLGTLDTYRGWEALYGKNIAWEYFDNADSPAKAVKEEVKTGRRWFKFRHMNEFDIVRVLELAFPDHVPTLVVGHSHEPRLRPGLLWEGVDRRQIDFYLNSGAAGRFENLIWAIELIDGEPFLVSWHREVREEGAVPVRTVWEDVYTGSRYNVRPQSSATLAELLAGEEEDTEDDLVLRIAMEHAL